MKGRGFAFGFLIVCAIARAFAESPKAPMNVFQAVDVYVDSGTARLAAYQIEFKSKTGAARIVGVEGGEALPFNPAPHYDPKAIEQERVVIAAFSTETATRLPLGKTRVATIHLLLETRRDAEFAIQLDAAAGPDGAAIDARATFEERTQP